MAHCRADGRRRGRRMSSPHPNGARRLAIRGTGVQAELTVRTLDAIGALPPQVAIWGRSYDKATRLAHALGSTTREIVV